MKKYSLWMIIIACVVLLAGCGNSGQSKSKQLTAKEIAQANEALVSVMETEDGFAASEISCFFSCVYEKPEDISLREFLRYCPVGERLEDVESEEYAAFVSAEAMENPGSHDWEAFPVPVRRYSKEAVSAILKKYGNITVDDLTSLDGVIYLEGYDAFYNTTSDFAPGSFQCVGGEKEGDTVRLWSDADENGNRMQLTLAAVDGTYYIQSFQKVNS